MFYVVVVTLVLGAWKLLGFIDAYVGGKLAARISRAAVALIGAVSLIAPNAFAEGTKRYLDAETAQWTAWMQDYLHDMLKILPPSAPPTSPPSTTTTTMTTDG